MPCTMSARPALGGSPETSPPLRNANLDPTLRGTISKIKMDGKDGPSLYVASHRGKRHARGSWSVARWRLTPFQLSAREASQPLARAQRPRIAPRAVSILGCTVSKKLPNHEMKKGALKQEKMTGRKGRRWSSGKVFMWAGGKTHLYLGRRD